mmetsp:Transcript_64678/g.54890  ORF Transcript_64678/g.54890 Transcript_64678/m.54890 type:complete len:124 (-) Transcript_64678:279-650(-)
MDVHQIETGHSFTCALEVYFGDQELAKHARSLTPKLKCWGKNSVGQLDIPVGLLESNLIKQLATGYKHVCAHFTIGLRCWGQDLFNKTKDVSNVSLDVYNKKEGEGGIDTLIDNNKSKNKVKD